MSEALCLDLKRETLLQRRGQYTGSGCRDT